MKPASRSPWADWVKFMKSMSIVSHGRPRPNCVCKCKMGLVSERQHKTDILEGENVCIHKITPTQLAVLLAAMQVARISSGVVSTGLETSLIGRCPDLFSISTSMLEFLATCSSAFGP